MNRSYAKIRALVEQAAATLESWRLLRKLRCSTTRITSLVQVVLTLSSDQLRVKAEGLTDHVVRYQSSPLLASVLRR